MEQTSILPPRTINEVHALLPEGTLAQIIEGNLVMSPAPNLRHQRLAAVIFVKLFTHVQSTKLGEIFYSPLDVYLDENNILQPDIVFIKTERFSLFKDNGIHGAPDVIIEILSPGNNTHDVVTKKGVYEKSGVVEYWIIDPETKYATGYHLVNKQYLEFFSEKNKMQSLVLKATIEF